MRIAAPCRPHAEAIRSTRGSLCCSGRHESACCQSSGPGPPAVSHQGRLSVHRPASEAGHSFMTNAVPPTESYRAGQSESKPVGAQHTQSQAVRGVRAPSRTRVQDVGRARPLVVSPLPAFLALTCGRKAAAARTPRFGSHWVPTLPSVIL